MWCSEFGTSLKKSMVSTAPWALETDKIFFQVTNDKVNLKSNWILTTQKAGQTHSKIQQKSEDFWRLKIFFPTLLRFSIINLYFNLFFFLLVFLLIFLFVNLAFNIFPVFLSFLFLFSSFPFFSCFILCLSLLLYSYFSEIPFCLFLPFFLFFA